MLTAPALGERRRLARPISPSDYGTERMRQKLFVVRSGVLVDTSVPFASAGLVTTGTQLAGIRLTERSSA